MLTDIPKYQIISSENFKESEEVQKNGILDNVIVQLENNHRYKIVFIDFYRLTEEFVRSREFYQLQWFAKPELVIVKMINLKTIEEAVATLLKQNYFSYLSPLTLGRVDSCERNTKHSIVFPEWYNDPQSEIECEDKGFLDNAVVELKNGCRYNVHFEDFISFTQRFAASARLGEVYVAEPGLVIVSSVTPDVMKNAVSWLVEQDYFRYLRPLSRETTEK